MVVEHYCDNILDSSLCREYNDAQFLQDEIERDFRQRRDDWFTAVQTYIKDKNILAREVSKEKDKKGKTNGDIKWVNPTLTAADKIYAAEWIGGHKAESFGYILNLCERGFSVAVKPNKDGGWSSYSFGSVDVDGSRCDIGVAAHAENAELALLGLLFKMVVCLEFGELAGDYINTSQSLFR